MIKLIELGRDERLRLCRKVEPFFICAKKNKNFQLIHNTLMSEIPAKYSLEVWCLITGCTKALRHNLTRFYLPRAKPTYTTARKFTNQAISYKRMMEVCDILEGLGYIENFIGFRLDEDNYAKSFIDIQPELLELFDVSMCKRYGMKRELGVVEVTYTEKVKVKGKRPKKIKHSINTQGMKGVAEKKRNVTKYNKVLSVNEVSIMGDAVGCITYKQSFYKTLNGAGRFHVIGSTFQNEPSENRKTIEINGVPTCEIDIVCAQPSFLCAMNGMVRPNNHDPYGISITGNYDNGEYRKFCKSSFLTILFSRSEQEAKSAMFDKFVTDCRKGKEQRNLDSLRGVDQLITKTFDALMAHNSDISNHFFTEDLWATLQAMDSAICTHVINHFTNKDVPVLSYHDSWVIDYHYKQELIDTMREGWCKVVGDEGTNFAYDVEFDNTPTSTPFKIAQTC